MHARSHHTRMHAHMPRRKTLLVEGGAGAGEEFDSNVAMGDDKVEVSEEERQKIIVERQSRHQQRYNGPLPEDAEGAFANVKSLHENIVVVNKVVGKTTEELAAVELGSAAAQLAIYTGTKVPDKVLQDIKNKREVRTSPIGWPWDVAPPSQPTLAPLLYALVELSDLSSCPSFSLVV